MVVIEPGSTSPSSVTLYKFSILKDQNLPELLDLGKDKEGKVVPYQVTGRIRRLGLEV